MRHHRTPRALASGLALAALLLSPAALAQAPEEDFFKAYYLQHEEGRLEAALDLYRGVAHSKKADAGLRERAERAAKDLAQDLAASDFARLMPADAILYVELNRPGEQVAALVDQLGLLGVLDGGGGFGISPHLLEGALGVRGAALAITEVDLGGGPPKGVMVLHAGDQETLRGLIETGVPAGGTPTEPIAGYPTWQLEGQALVSLTSRVLIAGTSRDLVRGVAERLDGDAKGSLAAAESLRSAQALRGDDLLFFHLNAAPIVPLIRMQMEQEARRDPGAAMALAFLDVDSFKGFSGRLGVDGKGLGLDLELQLAEGHQNLLFNLMRKPKLDRETLELVPAGAAFFLATSVNEASCVAPATGEPGRPIVTAMDFGRELFANIVDVVVYGLPPMGEPQQGWAAPDVVLALRVNDVDRSRALWDFVLGFASRSSGGASTAPEVVEVAGIECERYKVQGVPVFLVTRDKEMMVSASRSALARTIEARREGHTVLRDELFAGPLKQLGSDHVTALLVNPGRCAAMARPFLPERDRAELEPIAALLAETVFSVGVQQNDTTLAVHSRVERLPDLGPVVGQLLEQRRGGPRHRGLVAGANPVAAEPLSEEKPVDLHAVLVAVAEQGHQDNAHGILKKLVEENREDWNALNSLAWELLTEEPFRGRYTEAARKIAQVSNELSGFESWAALDTLALAEFESGEVEKAVKLEKKALQLAQGTGREAEIEAALKRFAKGLEEKERKAEKKSGKKSGKKVDALL